MVSYKNISIKKKGGGTRKQRVKVLKSGKYKFVKNLGSKARKLTKSRVKTRRKTRVVRRRGRKRGRRGSRKFTLPLAPILGLAVGLARPAQFLMAGEFENAAIEGARNYTGFDAQTGQFWVGNLAKGLLPLLIGALVHKFVGGAPLNVNRMLAAANVPVIRI